MAIYGTCETCGGETRNYGCYNCDIKKLKAERDEARAGRVSAESTIGTLAKERDAGRAMQAQSEANAGIALKTFEAYFQRACEMAAKYRLLWPRSNNSRTQYETEMENLVKSIRAEIMAEVDKEPRP